ncbi:MAG: type III pantothenate kinase [Victivallaceae bacterium]|nr:type III pantothenate kinase [Victivallaceae bacterium]
MNLLNIGNTHSTLGIWQNQRFERVVSIPTPELTAQWIGGGETFAASVVPEAAARIAGENIHFIDARNCNKSIDFSCVDSAKLGADRVANAFALARFFATPALVIDCGTAITFEILDAQRRFYSGAIAPGRKLMRQALNTGTAQLPELPFYPDAPENFGNDTIGNLRFGIDRGIIGMVRELLAKTVAAIPVKNIVVTGGDDAFFLPELPGAQPAPENFTLYGILYAAEK